MKEIKHPLDKAIGVSERMRETASADLLLQQHRAASQRLTVIEVSNRLLLAGSMALLISTSDEASGFLFAFVAVFLSVLWILERGRLVYRMRSLEGLLAASSGEAGEDLYIKSRYEERSMSFRGRLLSLEPTLWIYLSLATLAAKVFWGD